MDSDCTSDGPNLSWGSIIIYFVFLFIVLWETSIINDSSRNDKLLVQQKELEQQDRNYLTWLWIAMILLTVGLVFILAGNCQVGDIIRLIALFIFIGVSIYGMSIAWDRNSARVFSETISCLCGSDLMNQKSESTPDATTEATS